MSLDEKLRNLAGPVLVLGASGFIGANLLRRLLAVRSDVFGTVFSGDTWRLDSVPSANIAFLNLQDPVSVRSVLHHAGPRQSLIALLLGPILSNRTMSVFTRQTT